MVNGKTKNNLMGNNKFKIKIKHWKIMWMNNK